MIELRRLWAERSPREQRLLLVLAALLAAMALWLLILRPLDDARAAARARLDTATIESGLIAARVAEIRDARAHAPPPLALPLAAAVQQSAGDAGFTLGTAEPRGAGLVAVTVANAKAPALFAWLAALERQGIRVERIALKPNGDATLAVDLTLRGGGR